MPISEQQLETWSHQGSVAQSKATHEGIRAVLRSSDSPYHSRSFDDFLQGSYANDTNIYADSDVDIVVRLTSTFYSNTGDLQPADLFAYQQNRVPAVYQLSDFKREVVGWLRQHYAGVEARNKAIFIPGSGNRREADIVISAEHRHYISYLGFMGPQYREGLMIEAANGNRIINYPLLHRQNLTNKNQATNSWVKRTVRIFKNMRNRMIAEGFLEVGVAPSYFIEGLIYNVPNSHFGPTDMTSVSNCLNFIINSNWDSLTCANEVHWLVRNGHDVCWSPVNYERFVKNLVHFWNNS